MASEADERRKCFTFIWRIENPDYWWERNRLESPTFKVDEMYETKWKLILYFSFQSKYERSHLYLIRQDDFDGEHFDCELAFLSSDGAVLHSFRENDILSFYEGAEIGSDEFPSRYEVFQARRSEFISQDTLTVRCRMWKREGELPDNVQCLAHSRIILEKRSCLWKIENFSSLKPNDKRKYAIKSLINGEEMMSLELRLTDALSEEVFRLKVVPVYESAECSTFQLSIVDDCENTLKCVRGEILDDTDEGFLLPYTRRDLIENKSTYLKNDVLSLSCECVLSFGNLVEEVEYCSSDCVATKNPQNYDRCLDKVNELSTPKDILIDDFKSLLNNDMLSDIKLKTRNKTYSAHKSILSVRSPVFKAMFCNNMKEKNDGCVVIDDLSDETVLQMLRYIYSADVELEWNRAMELYEAADKYEILHLKDLCSSHLKSNLSSRNACKALLLADLHQDADFKSFVQSFILKNAKDVISSEEWDLLMESNIKLAAETMRLKCIE